MTTSITSRPPNTLPTFQRFRRALWAEISCISFSKAAFVAVDGFSWKARYAITRSSRRYGSLAWFPLQRPSEMAKNACSRMTTAIKTFTTHYCDGIQPTSNHFFTCVCIHRIQSPSLGVGNCAVVSVMTATAALFSPVRGLNHFTSGEGGSELRRISIVRSSGT